MEHRKFLDLVGLQELLRKLDEKYASIQALMYKGSVETISNLPDVRTVSTGWMYSIVTGGLTTDDFTVGAGQTLQNDENVIAVNIAPAGSPAVMKWDILGGVFKIDDRLQFGPEFPANPSIGDTFLYFGNTIYEYAPVTNPAGENPAERGWYEYDQALDIYELTQDTEAEPGKTYYVYREKYRKGTIYVYSVGNIWAPQPYGGTIATIEKSEIENLFSNN